MHVQGVGIGILVNKAKMEKCERIGEGEGKVKGESGAFSFFPSSCLVQWFEQGRFPCFLLLFY